MGNVCVFIHEFVLWLQFIKCFFFFLFFLILSLCTLVPNVRFLLSNLESSWDIAGEVKIEYKMNVPREQSS